MPAISFTLSSGTSRPSKLLLRRRLAHHALLYELATVLQANGEGARALAVLLELQAEAGEYRDVSSRLEQLKVQMGS